MTRGKRVSYRCQDAGTQKDKFICKNTGTDTGTWVLKWTSPSKLCLSYSGFLVLGWGGVTTILRKHLKVTIKHSKTNLSLNPKVVSL